MAWVNNEWFRFSGGIAYKNISLLSKQNRIAIKAMYTIKPYDKGFSAIISDRLSFNLMELKDFHCWFDLQYYNLTSINLSISMNFLMNPLVNKYKIFFKNRSVSTLMKTTSPFNYLLSLSLSYNAPVNFLVNKSLEFMD